MAAPFLSFPAVVHQNSVSLPHAVINTSRQDDGGRGTLDLVHVSFHNDAEKGTLNFVSTLALRSEKGLGSSLALATAIPPKSDKPAKKPVSLWIRWQLWFNTYRKFFTFVVALNLTGIVCAAAGHWSYARKYTGSMVLGNLLFAILMRNELFGRLLYLVTNTLFAKVRLAPFWFVHGNLSSFVI